MESPVHQPVLLDRVAELLLGAGRGGVIVDCTIGLGGHAQRLLEIDSDLEVIGIDRDLEALERAAKRLQPWATRIRLVHGTFDRLGSLLAAIGVERVAGVLADLGVSSLQLDLGARGFSFRHDGPLDMRMDQSRGLTAADIVNQCSEAELEKILRDYGEERRARRIARALVEQRAAQPIETTGELREIVHRAQGRSRVGSSRHRSGGIDSATRTFQALRVEVNNELSGLSTLIDEALAMLESGGRLVVISYHSLEDRIVKTALREAAVGDTDPVTGRRLTETRLIELMTKKPLSPSDQEIRLNPRARSAKLRAARRL